MTCGAATVCCTLCGHGRIGVNTQDNRLRCFAWVDGCQLLTYAGTGNVSINYYPQNATLQTKGYQYPYTRFGLLQVIVCLES